jgi:hypothetical protein
MNDTPPLITPGHRHAMDAVLDEKLDQIIRQTSGTIPLDPDSFRPGMGWAQSLPLFKAGEQGVSIHITALRDGMEIMIRDAAGYTLWRQRLLATGTFQDDV